MAARQKFQKHSSIYGQIATDAETPESCEAADGCEIRRAGCDESEDGGDAESEVESPFSAPDVAAETPEDGAGEETDVLG